MSVDGDDIDRLSEFAIDFLLSGQGDARQLAARLAQGRPDRPSLEVIFILASAAAAIEEVLAGADSKALALDAWRIATLLGVDLHMMQLRGHPIACCGDLLRYWRSVDPFFLKGG